MTWDDSESLSLCLFRQMNHQCSDDLGYAMNTFIGCAIGRGPRQKNGKILTELSFFAVFNHKNDLEKVWKSRNEFKLVGFKVEKNGPCSRENEVKISKKRKMAKNDFSRSDLGS